MPMSMSFEFNVKMSAEQARAHYDCAEFVVRLYDGFDNQWCDCTDPMSWDDALKVLMEKTKDGTEKTKFSDIDYYNVFPADTSMLYADGRGENLRGEVPPPKPDRPCRFCHGTGKKHPENTGAQFNCWDCKKPCGDYCVESAIWGQAMPDYHKLRKELQKKYGGTQEEFRVTIRLCLGCLSVRLNRVLVPKDFTSAAINDVIRMGISIGIRTMNPTGDLDAFPREIKDE